MYQCNDNHIPYKNGNTVINNNNSSYNAARISNMVITGVLEDHFTQKFKH